MGSDEKLYCGGRESSVRAARSAELRVQTPSARMQKLNFTQLARIPLRCCGASGALCFWHWGDLLLIHGHKRSKKLQNVILL